MSGIGAVIFDFNGVLVDDESVHFALFQEVLAEEGVAITERDYHERYLGYDDRKCFEAALDDAGRSHNRQHIDTLIARKARRYVEVAAEGLRFFPSAAEILGMVASRWPVAICSGALRSEIEYALRRLDRIDQVAAIISADDTDKCKPDPEGYRLALEALRAHERVYRGQGERARADAEPLVARRCVVVEDSLAGIIAAKRAGMRTVGVTNTYSAHELEEAGADAVITGLDIFTPDWVDRRFAS